MKSRIQKSTALIFTAALLGGCGPSMGVVGVGGMPMGGGYGMMGMPMGGFAYGGSWGHSSTNVAVVNNHTTDVYSSSHNTNVYDSNHTNNAFADNHGGTGGDYYHPGRSR